MSGSRRCRRSKWGMKGRGVEGGRMRRSRRSRRMKRGSKGGGEEQGEEGIRWGRGCRGKIVLKGGGGMWGEEWGELVVRGLGRRRG